MTALLSNVPDLLGNTTLPFVDGELHKRHKQTLLSAFAPGPMAGYIKIMSPIIERHTARWESLGEFIWYPENETLVMSLFMSVFTGAQPTEEDSQLRHDLDTFILGITALPFPIPGGAFRRARGAKVRILRYLGSAVASRAESPGTDVLSRFLEARDTAGQPLSHEQIQREMLHLFFAGYGGMAVGLTYTALALGADASVREQARAEVARVCPAGPITLDQLTRLESYVGRVWKEVMRFYPTVPHTAFGRVIEEFECHGYRVPAGWKASAGIYASQRNPQCFDLPDRFDPDRFGPERAEDRKHPYGFVPQGGPPADGHRCLGESLSALITKLFTIHLLREHTWELLSDDNHLDLSQFPPKIVNGLPVRFRRIVN